MNEHVTEFPPMPATTQAAEGLRRRPWSVAEIEAMVRAGIIDEDERLELIGGEVVPMLPKGGRHKMVKLELNRHFQKSGPDDLWIAQETTLRLDDKSFLEPDFCVFPRSIYPGDLRGHDVLLAVEVADTSISYDRGRKLGVYAAYGIPEVWVVDAATLVTHVHRGPDADGYATSFDVGPEDDVVSSRVEAVRFSFADLALAPHAR
jgi:Uma2 family endonuclease